LTDHDPELEELYRLTRHYCGVNDKTVRQIARAIREGILPPLTGVVMLTLLAFHKIMCNDILARINQLRHYEEQSNYWGE